MMPKFESNVATELPKIKAANEPRLPWHVRPKGLSAGITQDGLYRWKAETIVPLGVRPVFLITLLAGIFISMVTMVMNFEARDRTMRVGMRQTEETTALLLANLKKTAKVKKSFEEKTVKLEKDVNLLYTQNNELSARNRTLTGVVERLSKTAGGAQTP